MDNRGTENKEAYLKFIWLLFLFRGPERLMNLSNLFTNGKIGQMVSFKRSKTGLNLEFSYYLTLSNQGYRTQPTLLYTHSWRGTDEFIPFPRKLVQKEAQKALSRIWTRITDAIAYENNCVVVMRRTILPRRNRRCALSATGTCKPEEEKDARGVTYFMEENVISPREVVRFNEHIRN